VYNPLVVDRGTQPAVAPVRPTLPQGAIVALWFGTNAATLTLRGTDGSLKKGHCVNGADGTIFDQFAYCNAPAFFQAATQAITSGQLVPPQLLQGKDGETCPSVRDFSLVDADQSDNVTTTYLVTAQGQIAQDTQANASLQQQRLFNGSDNALLVRSLDAALGCPPWQVNNLADPGSTTSALPLNELQASVFQGKPIALVPNLDPMVTSAGHADLVKLNAYRKGVGQPRSPSAQASSTSAYCQHLLAIAPQRIKLDAPFTVKAPSPDPAQANSLLAFLANRLVVTYSAKGLDCVDMLKSTPLPIAVQTNEDGVAIQVTMNGTPLATSMT